ncbi:MAG TPA: lipoate--protein ligase [Microscillaceae bacterium]|nr:lipoate--protein ligase [Microscillaceae bacterium]
MHYIDNQGITDPKVNLAIEEHVLRNFDPTGEFLMLYINAPSVILGKHQNVFEEVNVDFVQESGVQVVRRVSGGGTVYHDLGNLNFSYLVPHDAAKVNNYQYFLNPIVAALQSLGVPAEISPRNDIMAAGKKVSGNAQFSTTKRMVSHGTLLFNSEIIHLSQSLKALDSNIQSKSIKSYRSPVANIATYLSPAQRQELDMEQFKKVLLKHIFQTEEIPVYQLTPEDWEVVNTLVQEKYSTWEWNFARSPKFSLENTAEINDTKITAQLQVKKGYITSITFGGEGNDKGWQTLAEQLIGSKFEKNALKTKLEEVKAETLTQASPEQILSFIWV